MAGWSSSRASCRFCSARSTRGGALLPIAEIVEEVDESWARILGSVLVVLVATTVLAPLLRRLQSAPKEPAKALAA